jgi:hypothetical protein
MEQLRKIYQDNFFPPKNKLYKLQKEAALNLSKKQVDDFIKKQEVYQLTSKQNKQKIFNSIVVPKVNSAWQIDLIIFDRYKINNYQYILNCVDIKSRYAYGVALTKKDKTTVINGMRKVIKKMGKAPEQLNMDNGGEFTSTQFKEAMIKEGVKEFVYSDVNDTRKQAIIERLNRTITEILQKWREATGERDWYNILDKIYTAYNNSVHSTIKNKPIDVWRGDADNEQTIIKIINKLKPGDKVRIIQNKKTFEKGDTTRVSRKIYKISKLISNKYILENDEGDELKTKYSSDQLRFIDDVDESTKIEKTKQDKIDKQLNDNRKEKRINKELNQLKTVGDSSFIDSLKNLNSKRKRKPKVIKD